MREIRVCVPTRRQRMADVAVRRLRFDTAGTRLLAEVGVDVPASFGRYGFTTSVFEYDLAADRAVRIADADRDANPGPLPRYQRAVSADLRFVVAWSDWVINGYEQTQDYLIDRTKPHEDAIPIPDNPFWSDETTYALDGTPIVGFLELAFTPDGRQLVAARNRPDGEEVIAEVAVLALDALTRPPRRFREMANPFTGQPIRVPVRPPVRLRPVATLPAGEAARSLGVSGDGRRIAVGTLAGSVQVVNLRSRRLTASFPWEGQKRRDRAALRVGFDPGTRWVVSLANGRVFARPLKDKTGTAWQTKAALGYQHDFAFSPDGNTLAVVDAAGAARFLDPASGAVRRAFRWRRGPLYSVAFAPDGLTCAAGAGAGRVLVWDVDT
jgi:WD40 repeat protein